MSAKEIQKNFITSYLKPLLKQNSYLTNSLTWWKNMNTFFIIINLQNSQWNDKAELSFCFNIGIALSSKLKDPNKKKATYFDIVTHFREGAYLSPSRNNQKYRQEGWLGYKMTDKTDLNDFISEFKIDFENEILPTLNNLKSLSDCINFYKDKGNGSGQFFKQLQEIQSV